jgi:spore coat polysaccharide biosynthesis predicted glycosyltransferase SpsG
MALIQSKRTARLVENYHIHEVVNINEHVQENDSAIQAGGGGAWEGPVATTGATRCRLLVGTCTCEDHGGRLFIRGT